MSLHPSHVPLVRRGRCLGCDKRLYLSQETASSAADRNTLMYGPTWSYRCPYGLGWHLTSKPQLDEPTGTHATRRKKEAHRRQRLRLRLGLPNPEFQDVPVASLVGAETKEHQTT